MLAFDYKADDEIFMTNKEFVADKEVLPNVMEFVEETLESYGCNLKIQTAISVAIEEIFVNIANYAYPDNQGNVKITMSFNEKSRIVTFKISDGGIKFNPLEMKEPDVTLSVEERNIGGLGILITKKTMDTLKYSYLNNKNILTMTKKI